MGRLGRPSNDTAANKAFSAVAPIHHGTDWGWGQGDAVYAMADGTVVDVQTLTDYGKIIVIDHGPLIAGVTQTRYCHLSRQDVVVGTKLNPTVVKRGQQIGVMGNTGSLIPVINGVKAKHLHSELWLNGARVDEQPYEKEADMAPNTRTVKATNANRRTTPSVPVPPAPDNLDPTNLTFNTSYPVIGYRTDLNPGHIINGSNKWFLVAKDGKELYSHASTFTDQSTTGITSLDPVVPPVVPGYPTAAAIAAATALLLEPKFLELNEKIDALPKEFVLTGSAKPKP